MGAWQRRGGRTAYENAWIRVEHDEVIRPDGTDGVYGVVELRHPAVFVVPLSEAGEVLMVQVDRYTVGPSLEIPAGGSDGEEPERAAHRELLEETGYAAQSMQIVGRINSLNGICRAPGFVFVATGLRRAAGGVEQAEEGISEARWIAWDDVMAKLRASEIRDAETAAALMFASAHRGLAMPLPNPQ